MKEQLEHFRSLLGTGKIDKLKAAFQTIKKLALAAPRQIKRDVGRIVREVCQDVAVELIDNYPAVLLEFATGVGKTRPAVKAITKQPCTVLIIHKQIPHKKNLEGQISEWADKDYRNRPDEYTIQFTTYKSLYKYVRTSWDYVIMDECHAITDNNIVFLKGIRMNKLIMLSATVPREKRTLISELCKHHFQCRCMRFELSLIEAINTGILPIPRIVVIDRYLDSRQRNLTYTRIRLKDYSTIRVSFQDRVKYPYNNLDIVCSEYEYYQCLCEDMEYWKNKYFIQKQDWVKFKWLQFGARRKTWLSDLKTDLAVELKGKLRSQSRRFICFATTISQCELISGDKVAVHSKSEDNQGVIDRFNNIEQDELYAVNVLNESMNLTHLDDAIFVSLAGVKLQNVQRAGRSFRADDPTIYILRVPYTKDDDNFRKFLGELSEEFVTYKNVE